MSITPVHSIPPGIKIIGIHGHAGVGKDTVALYLNERYDNVYVKAFADPLKDAASNLMGMDIDSFYDREAKEEVHPYWGVSPRQVAQFFGTEMVRRNMGKLLGVDAEDFWIRRMAAMINQDLLTSPDEGTYGEGDTIIIPDVRFQNEYEWIVANGGSVIHLTRPGCSGNIGIQSHTSEAGIQITSPNNTWRISNHGTKEQLYAQVDEVFMSINL